MSFSSCWSKEFLSGWSSGTSEFHKNLSEDVQNTVESLQLDDKEKEGTKSDRRPPGLETVAQVAFVCVCFEEIDASPP